MRRLLALLASTIALTAAAVGVSSGAPSPATHADKSAGPGLGIHHVFVIVLENESSESTYLHNPHPYLGKVLQRQGTLLTNYYATGHVSLDNYIAMISGQAPNLMTSSDCQVYLNFNATTAPATLNSNGQAVGLGCVYPSNVMTLANQLSAHHISWHGYMDEMGNNPSREQTRCGVPHTNLIGQDGTQTATEGDQYAARHNPFVYFHSLIDSGLCRKNVVPLTELPKALEKASTTPDFDFITPDLCDDGHDTGCAGPDARGKRTGGLASVDDFLSLWIPRIERSPAYRENGIIIITSDESETNDSTSCCGEKPGPTDPLPGLTGSGGGKIGTLVIGRCVAKGKRDAVPYNHYSLLRSLENIFGITTGGTDGHGHLGYAAAAGLRPFGSDLFSTCKNPT
ncbi:MAG TPA: alkaline phosphatase family protein [Mycobacteriales bacterium]|nr:alkaline phosphatase family protein [Mycobacteriales bacterium]